MDVKPAPENSEQPSTPEQTPVQETAHEEPTVSEVAPDRSEQAVSSEEKPQESSESSADVPQAEAVPAVNEQPAAAPSTPQDAQPAQPISTPQPVAPDPMAPTTVTPATGQAPAGDENPEKNYLLALAFSYLLGALGIDRFYLGRTVTGILKLITLGGFGIWHFIDLLLIAFGKLKDKGNPAPLEGYGKFHKTMRPIAIVLLVIEALVLVGVLLVIVISAVAGFHEASSNNTSPFTTTQPSVQQNLYSN